ncbi:hypothetical protein M0R72_17795 [Candidatus Pacearchaeota archaeon]|jgi:hypothetical protein|nr:hypothetical protein [Candidatus Pacearchaeota archaeon]
MSTTVEVMLKAKLAELGANGLVNPGEECGCGTDDIAPCGSLNMSECVAAKWVPKSEADPEIMELQDSGADGYFEALPEGEV